jgi:hypothetical protein
VTATRFNATRLGVGDFMVGVGSVVLMIGIFLPWFDFGSGATGYFSFDAVAVRGWMYLPFFMALAVVGYLVVKASAGQVRLPVPHRLFLLGACSVDLAATLVCFAKKALGVSWDIGAYVSLVAAGVALVGAVVRSLEHVASPDRALSSSATSKGET